MQSPLNSLYKGQIVSVASTLSSSPINLGDGLETVYVDATSGNIIVNLPTATASPGQLFTVKKIDATSHTVTVTRASADLIEGATTIVLAGQWSATSLTNDGVSSWYKAGGTGGSLTTYDTFSNRPNAGVKGNVFVASNAPVAMWVDDGGTWRPLLQGQVVGIQPKAASNFTAVSTAGGTFGLADQNGSLHYKATSQAGTMGAFAESLPGALIVEAAISPNGIDTGAGFNYPAIFMKDSTSGTFYTIGHVSLWNTDATKAGSFSISTYRWTSFTTRDTVNDKVRIPVNGPVFVRLRFDGANVNGEYSTDRQNWFTVYSVAVAGGYVPNQVGICGFCFSNTEDLEFDVLHYNSGT